jgi:hypothetical protein
VANLFFKKLPFWVTTQKAGKEESSQILLSYPVIIMLSLQFLVINNFRELNHFASSATETHPVNTCIGNQIVLHVKKESEITGFS